MLGNFFILYFCCVLLCVYLYGPANGRLPTDFLDFPCLQARARMTSQLQLATAFSHANLQSRLTEIKALAFSKQPSYPSFQIPHLAVR